MSSAALKDFYDRYIAGLNARDWATVGMLLADDLNVNGTAYKRDDVIASLEGIADAVPDFRWTVQDLFTEDNRIAARLRDTGTPVKLFLSHQPSGGGFNIMEYGSYRVENGQFVEMWFLIDATAVGEQLRSQVMSQVRRSDGPDPEHHVDDGGIRKFSRADAVFERAPDQNGEFFAGNLIDQRHGGPITVGYGRYAPDQNIEETLVVHDVMILLEGRLSVSAGDTTVTAGPGEVVYMPKGEKVTIRSFEEGAVTSYVTYPHWQQPDE